MSTGTWPARPQRRVGRCELFGRIARGGMASIYLGRWLGDGGFRRLVAVKSLHEPMTRDPSLQRMLLDEARIGARVQHANVVSTIDVMTEAGEIFLVMDLVEGATLKQILARARALDEDVPTNVTKRILIDLLHGLHAAHETRDEHGEPLSVVHRDVAPDNVLLGVDGRSRLLDFGIARASGRFTQTQPGIVKGKLAYLAPEQFLDRPLTRRTDVYGTAVVAWQLVTGTRLFQGSSASTLAAEILDRPIERPSLIASGDGALDTIIMKGLEREPDDRWETAEAMAAAIEAVGGAASWAEVAAWLGRLAPPKLVRLSRAMRRVEALPPMPLTPSGDAPMSLPPIEMDETKATCPGAGREGRAGAGWFYALGAVALTVGTVAFASGSGDWTAICSETAAGASRSAIEARPPVSVGDVHRATRARADGGAPIAECSQLSSAPMAGEPKAMRTAPNWAIAAPAAPRAAPRWRQARPITRAPTGPSSADLRRLPDDI
jgi:eukaryotic-like serine/threonine-protein kinase